MSYESCALSRTEGRSKEHMNSNPEDLVADGGGVASTDEGH